MQGAEQLLFWMLEGTATTSSTRVEAGKGTRAAILFVNDVEGLLCNDRLCWFLRSEQRHQPFWVGGRALIVPRGEVLVGIQAEV